MKMLSSSKDKLKKSVVYKKACTIHTSMHTNLNNNIAHVNVIILVMLRYRCNSRDVF